jgi:hypothetical protein
MEWGQVREKRNELWRANTHVEAMGMYMRKIRLCFISISHIRG